MEENKNIDDLFRDAIENYKMDPPEGVWNSMDEALAEKRNAMARKKTMRRVITSLAALFLLSGGLYLYFSGTGIPAVKDGSSSVQRSGNSQQNSGNGTITSDKVTQNGSALSDKRKPGNSVQQTPIADGSAANDNSNLNPSKENSELQHKSKSVTTNPSSVGSKQKLPDNSSPVATNNSQRNSHAGNPVEIKKQVPGNSTGNNSGITMDQTEHRNGSDKNVGAQDLTAGSTPGAKTGQEQNASSATGTVARESSQQTAGETIVPETSEPAANELATAEDAAAKEAAAEPAQVIAADSVVDYNADKSSEKWIKKVSKLLSMDVYYSPDMAWRSLKTNSAYTGTGASEGTSEFNKNESSNYSWSAGLRFRAELGTHWSVATGVNYNTFSQSSTASNVFVVSDSAFHHDHGPGHGGGHGGPSTGGGSSHYVIHTSCGTIDLDNHSHWSGGPGGPPGNGDTLNVTTKTTEEISYVSVPFTARYQISGKRISWYAEGGASINFEYTNSVTAVVNNSYSETNEIVGLKSINYSALFGVGMQYNIHGNWGVFLEPGLRYSLTSINESSPVLSYPYYLGIKTGFSLHF
jgi:hypothetical protein